mgnify:CR=1 FL=1
MTLKNDSDSYNRVKSLINLSKNMFKSDITLYIGATDKVQHYFNKAINEIMKLMEEIEYDIY